MLYASWEKGKSLIYLLMVKDGLLFSLFLTMYLCAGPMDQFTKRCTKKVDKYSLLNRYRWIPTYRRLLRKYQLCNNATLHMLLNTMEVTLRIQIYG